MSKDCTDLLTYINILLHKINNWLLQIYVLMIFMLIRTNSNIY